MGSSGLRGGGRHGDCKTAVCPGLRTRKDGAPWAVASWGSRSTSPSFRTGSNVGPLRHTISPCQVRSGSTHSLQTRFHTLILRSRHLEHPYRDFLWALRVLWSLDGDWSSEDRSMLVDSLWLSASGNEPPCRFATDSELKMTGREGRANFGLLKPSCKFSCLSSKGRDDRCT